MRGFRAWHTKLGRYLKDNEFYVNSDGSVCSAFETYDDEILKIDYIEDFSRDDFDEGYIIREDGTDLKDKNGKEIYEGDIVERKKLITAREMAVPGWGEDHTEIRRAAIVFEHGAFYGRSITAGINADYSWDELEADFEVIGNVHENQELLEDNQ